MRVRLLQNLQPLELTADEVIVVDEFGDPLIIAMRLDTRQHLVAKRGDPDFNQTLDMLGLPQVRTDMIEGPKHPGIILSQ